VVENHCGPWQLHGLVVVKESNYAERIGVRKLMDVSVVTHGAQQTRTWGVFGKEKKNQILSFLSKLILVISKIFH
jgi:hypothetical protein